MMEQERFDALLSAYTRIQLTLQDAILQSRMDFEDGRRREAFKEIWKLASFETTPYQRLYLAKLALKSSKVCADDGDLEAASDWAKASFSFSRANPSGEARHICCQALVALVKLFSLGRQWSAASVCLDLLPRDFDAFLKHCLELLITLYYNQTNRTSGKVEDLFIRCLNAENFKTLNQCKQLLSLILSTSTFGLFDESTLVGHLFQETRKLVNLSEVEKEESFSLEITYYFERKNYDQAFQVLSAFILTQKNSNTETINDNAPPSAPFLRILDFSADIGEKFSSQRNYDEAIKWFSALVFLCEKTSQPKDRVLHNLVWCVSELQGYDAARNLLQAYESAEPENMTIRKLGLELALQHGDQEIRKKVLLKEFNREVLTETSPSTLSSILDFFAKASEIDLQEVAVLLESITCGSSKLPSEELKALSFKILIRTYTHLWSTEIESQTDSIYLPKLVSSLERALKMDYDELVDFRKWIHVICWNTGLLAKGFKDKVKIFGLAAECLPTNDQERMDCYVMQMASGMRLLGNDGDSQETSLAAEKLHPDILNQLVSLAEDMRSLLDNLEINQARDDFTEVKRMVAVFKLKLTLHNADFHQRVEEVISQLKKDNDSLGLQMVLDQLMNVSSSRKDTLTMARIACTNAVIDSLPTDSSALPYCNYLLDELLSNSMDLLKEEIGKVVQAIIFICKNDRTVAQEQVLVSCSKLWNASLKYCLLGKESISDHLRQLSVALSEWAPSFQNLLKEKMK